MTLFNTIIFFLSLRPLRPLRETNKYHVTITTYILTTLSKKVTVFLLFSSYNFAILLQFSRRPVKT